MTRKLTILFDLDGTLVDTAPDLMNAHNYVMKKFGYSTRGVEEIRNLVGKGASVLIGRSLWESAKKEFSQITDEKTKNKMVKEFIDFYGNNIVKESKLIDGVLELIKHYHMKGITLVLASSASMPNINMIFKKFGLDPYFKAKISGADLKASKPHPEIFEKATELTGSSKNECVVIEDATNGILAAKAAGLFCIAYNGGYSKNQDYSNADMVITNFKDIHLERLSIN